MLGGVITACIFIVSFLELADPDIKVDHVDGDGLNCQDENMRVCTNQENMHNRTKYKNNKSGFKGVNFLRGKFVASIRVDGKKQVC